MAKFPPYSRQKCPQCLTTVRFEVSPVAHRNEKSPEGGIPVYRYGGENDQILDLIAGKCPECKTSVVNIDIVRPGDVSGIDEGDDYVIWPLTSGRPPAPSDVPDNIAQDYNEACLVLPFSPKASAALSRRALQSILTDPNAGNSQAHNLSQQIDEVLDDLPSYVANSLDAVREIGNFAAHEQKSINTGEILDVEQGEAEWNLEILETLFDFYYVKPAEEQRKLDEMNQKLAEAGRRPLRQPAGDEDGQT